MSELEKVNESLSKDSEAINVAVKFWGDFLRGKKPTRFFNKLYEKGKKPLGAMNAEWQREKLGNFDGNTVKVFEAKLAEYLVNPDTCIDKIMVVNTPDSIISTALIGAGIKVCNYILPWMTEMEFRVRDDMLTIVVACGRRSSYVPIYSQDPNYAMLMWEK